MSASASMASARAPDAAVAPPRRAGPSRPTLAVCGIVVALVTAAQIPLAVGLLGPNLQYEAGHAKAVLAANALLAVLIVAAASRPGRLRLLALVPGGALAGATLLGAVTVGGHLWDFGAAILTAAGAWWIGRTALRALGADRLTGVVVISATIGMGTIGLAVLCLGRLGAIRWWTLGLLIVLTGIAGLTSALPLAWERREAVWEAVTGSSLGVACAGLLLLQLGWIVVWLSAPEIMYDPLFSKTYLPDLWARTGAIHPLLLHPQLNIMGLAQVVAVPGHTLRAGDVGRELQLLAWCGLAATVWWWGRRSAAGPFAALAVGIAPQLVWQSTTAFDDLLLATGAAALALAVFQTVGDTPPAERDAPLGTAVAIGLLTGSCIWLKLHLLVVALVLAAGWLLAAGPIRRLPRRLAGVALGALVVAGPVLALRWIDTGNPVFPTYNSIFRSPHYPPIDEPYNFPFWHGVHFWGIVKLPYEAIVHPFLMSEDAPAGSFGLLVAAGVIAVAIGWRDRRGRATLIVWAAVVAALVAWWIQFRYLRYAIPAATVATLLVVAQLRDWRPGRIAGLAMLAAAAAGSAFYLPSAVATFWNVPHRNLPFAAAFGRWSAEDYLRTVFPEKDALAAFERVAPRGANALSDAHERLFVHDRELSPPWEVSRLMELYGPDPATPDAVLARLRRLGIHWAIVSEITGPSNALPWVSALVAAHGTPVFADRGWQVYRLVDRPSRPRPLADCDPQLRGAGGCWAGRLDARPGLSDGESPGGVTRNLPVCPGETVAVELTTAPTGQGAQVSLNGNSGDPKAGHTAGTVPAGSTGWVYGTAPSGTTAMNVLIAPGAGGAVTEAHTAVLGRCASNVR